MKDKDRDGRLREKSMGKEECGEGRVDVGGAARAGCTVHEGMVAGFARRHCENTRN